MFAITNDLKVHFAILDFEVQSFPIKQSSDMWMVTSTQLCNFNNICKFEY